MLSFRSKRLEKRFYKLKQEEENLNAELERAKSTPNTPKRKAVKAALRLEHKQFQFRQKVLKFAGDLAIWRIYADKQPPIEQEFLELQKRVLHK